MRILLDSIPGDLHTSAIGWAVSRLGHDVERLFLTDFPARLRVSWRGGASMDELRSRIGSEVVELTGFDAAVIRRRALPTLPEGLHPSDCAFAMAEASVLQDAAAGLGSPETFWINSHAAAHRAESKPLQLATARRLGLTIPETLISNDPKEALAFCADLGGRIAFKPLTPAGWRSDAGLAACYTALINQADLSSRTAAIELCPAIYQQYIEKAYELRVVVLGATVFAVRLDTQQDAAFATDWRIGMDAGLTPVTEVVVLSEALNAQCIAITRGMGLVFGCLDFCVDAAGRAYFLEINPMGQFLWLERLRPELPLLAAFAGFLASADPEYVHARSAEPDGGYAAFCASPSYRQALEEAAAHLPYKRKSMEHPE
jgi:hypothetical protein